MRKACCGEHRRVQAPECCWIKTLNIWLRIVPELKLSIALRDPGQTTCGSDWIESRCEDVISDLEGEGKRVAAFLGLPWDARQAQYHEHSRRKFLIAPTYHGVTEPVCRRGHGTVATLRRCPRSATRLECYCRAFAYAV